MASSLRSSSSSKPQRPRSISTSSNSTNDIASFAARLASSFDDDEDNNSIISLHEEFYDDSEQNADGGERRGLVDYTDLRGCGTASTGASSGCLAEHGAEGCCDDIAGEESSSLLLVSPSTDARRQCAYPLSEEGGITTCASHVEDDDNIIMMRHSQCCQLIITRARNNPTLSITAAILIGICTIYLLTSDQFRNLNILRTTNYIRSKTHQLGIKMHTNQNITFKPHPRPLDKTLHYPPFPAKELLGITINSSTIKGTSSIDPPYNPSDFHYQNKQGKIRTLTYWEEVVAAIEEFQENYRLLKEEQTQTTIMSSIANTPWTNITSWGPCFPRALQVTDDDKHIRSLVRKKKEKKLKRLISQNWTYIVQHSDIDTNDESSIQYPTYQHSFSKEEYYLGGLCRPGFLIIGQGKCGTSSLYKYLTGHDRVLPASQKQIHYFIFNAKKVSFEMVSAVYMYCIHLHNYHSHFITTVVEVVLQQFSFNRKFPWNGYTNDWRSITRLYALPLCD